MDRLSGLAGAMLFALALNGSSGSGPSQETGRGASSEEDLHGEMIRLIREIERSLTEIDHRLGSAQEADIEPLSELLRSTSATSERVVESIDRVLEIRRHHRGGT